MSRKKTYLVLAIIVVLSASALFFIYSRNRVYLEGRFYRIPQNLTPSMYQTEEDSAFSRKFNAYAGNEVIKWLRMKALGDIIGESQLKNLLRNAIEVGPDQYAGLYRRVALCAEILHMKPPRTFVIADPAVEARVTGPESPVLILNSGMLEALSPGEVQFMIGHQLGHISCGHVLPSTVADGILNVLRSYLPRNLAAVAVPASSMTLLQWTKDAEISADRAGLICAQGERQSTQALLRMLSGLPAISDKKYGAPDTEAFLRQKRESEKNALLSLTSLVDELSHGAGCHSYLATRVLELRDYARSPEYRRIMR